MNVTAFHIIVIVITITIVLLINKQSNMNSHNKLIVNTSQESPMFHWEHLQSNYSLDPNKNYLIYYNGLFSPPTRGHFSNLATAFLIKDYEL